MFVDFVLMHDTQDDHAPSVRRRRAQPRPESVGPVDEYGIPENPFAVPSAPMPQPRTQRRSRAERNAVQPELPKQEIGSQFAKPISPEVPEWLRVARQNNLPYDRPQAPRVQAAPRMQAEEYIQPPMPRAYRQPARQAPEPYAVESEEKPERELPGLRIPWLGIAAFVSVVAAVVLWIVQSNYLNQTAQVLDERAQREAQIVESHPLKYGEIISDKANKYNLHPAFVAAIMLNESSFRPDATSSVEARGLMQLMDDTAGWIYEKMDDQSVPYDFDNLYDPEINAEYGCWYLNYLSELFHGDPILVAAAFHAGQGEVRNWLNDSTYSKDGRTILIEDMIDGPTKRYVTRVLNDFAAYKRLYFGG